MPPVVLVCFWSAFAVDLVIVAYALRLSKRIGGEGILHTTILLTSAAALLFGIHHVLEVLLERVPNGVQFAESVEGMAALTLAFATFQFYRLVRGD